MELAFVPKQDYRLFLEMMVKFELEVNKIKGVPDIDLFGDKLITFERVDPDRLFKIFTNAIHSKDAKSIGVCIVTDEESKEELGFNFKRDVASLIPLYFNSYLAFEEIVKKAASDEKDEKIKVIVKEDGTLAFLDVVKFQEEQKKIKAILDPLVKEAKKKRGRPKKNKE